MAATLQHSVKPYHLKLFFSNLNTHAQVPLLALSWAGPPWVQKSHRPPIYLSPSALREHTSREQERVNVL